MRAALYARVSTEEQTEGYSLDAQVSTFRAYCKAQGWGIAREYVEPGVSGRSANRPEFQKMLAEAEARLFDVLVVHKLDRFSRSLRDTLDYLHKLERSEVALVSIVEAFDFTTPHGKLQMQILAAIAEWYSNNLGQEVKKGQTMRARAGLHAGTLTFGYRKGQDGVAVPYEPEAKVVRQIFTMYATGRHIAEEIAAGLNRAGHRAPSGRSWYDAGIMGVIRNPFYKGVVTYQGKTYPGKHKPLVTEEVFERCEKVRKDRGVHPRTGSPKLRVYTLAGIARCCECERRLYCLFSGKNLYYRCQSRQRGGSCSRSKTVIRADLLEAQVGEILKTLKPPEGWREKILDLLKVEEDDVESWRAERVRLEEKLKRIRQMYQEVEITQEEYHRELAETKERLANLTPPQVMRADEIVRAGEYLETLGPIWEAATPQERREIHHLVLESVSVDVLGKRLVEIRPKAAFAPLFKEVTG